MKGEGDGHLEIKIKPGMTYSQWLGVIGWLEVAKALRIMLWREQLHMDNVFDRVVVYGKE